MVKIIEATIQITNIYILNYNFSTFVKKNMYVILGEKVLITLFSNPLFKFCIWKMYKCLLNFN